MSAVLADAVTAPADMTTERGCCAGGWTEDRWAEEEWLEEGETTVETCESREKAACLSKE